MRDVFLRACGCTLAVHCPDEEIVGLMESVFGGLRVSPAEGHVIRRYSIDRLKQDEGFCVSDGAHSITLRDEDSLLYYIDQIIILSLQLARGDLLFIHAAVVALDRRAVVLAAASGTGKSTLTMALLADGLEYLTDELAPIDPNRLTVHPYPHALCLKSPPPPPHHMPSRIHQIGPRFHLPVAAMASVNTKDELPVAMFVFLRRDGERGSQLSSITQATAVARLMSHGLNLLAHGGEGLDAAIALSQRAPCFDLDISDLTRASGAIRETLGDAVCAIG